MLENILCEEYCTCMCFSFCNRMLDNPHRFQFDPGRRVSLWGLKADPRAASKVASLLKSTCPHAPDHLHLLADGTTFL